MLFTRVLNAMGAVDEDDDGDELVAGAAGGWTNGVGNAVHSVERQIAVSGTVAFFGKHLVT